MAILLGLGLKPGNKILVPIYTWPQLAGVPIRLGLKVLWADIDGQGKMSLSSVEKELKKGCKAIVVCHLFGNPVNVKEIISLAQKHNAWVIEDCSQSLFARHRGVYVGKWGHVGFASLGRDKMLSAGEGGIIWTNYPLLYDELYSLTQHNRRAANLSQQQKCLEFSLSLRMHPKAAAMGIKSLKSFHIRQQSAQLYYQKAIDYFTKQGWGNGLKVEEYDIPVWQYYPFLIKSQKTIKSGPVWWERQPAYLLEYIKPTRTALEFNQKIRLLDPKGIKAYDV